MNLNKKSRQSGFTLIELLAVVAILGILAGIGIPRIFGALNAARRGADEANVRLLQSAVDQWATIRNPGGVTAEWTNLIGTAAVRTLTTPRANPTIFSIPTTDTTVRPTMITALVTGGFINALPVAPAGVRVVPPDETGYTLQFTQIGTTGRWSVQVVPVPAIPTQ